MERRELERLAQDLLTGTISVDDLVNRLTPRPTSDRDEVQVDLDRRRRCGFPEVVFAEGKSVESLGKALSALLNDGADVLATRMNAEQAGKIAAIFPRGRYNALARTFRIAGEQRGEPLQSDRGQIAIVTAGTSDLAVAEEARETAEWMGVGATMVHDVGVAGPHRLPVRLGELTGADAIVVIAGMEGALPSVVGGYVDVPVIAVPTSVGYGANLGGLAALLGMLNSCAANVAVVNIDAGFKGAYVAGMIAHRASRARLLSESKSQDIRSRQGNTSD